VYSTYPGVELTSAKPSYFAPGRRRRLNALAIAVNALVPPMLFAALMALMSFKLHFSHPELTWCFVFAAIASICALVAITMITRKEGTDPSWFTVASISCVFALTVATMAGNYNFFAHSRPYYVYEEMNTLTGINPAREKGSQVDDAGRIFFASGSKVDKKMAMGFRYHETYCVAPIVDEHTRKDLVGTYDMWAVGVNCCTGDQSAFRCGDVDNPNARAGIRQIIDEDARSYFRLAVEQAEAAYGIKSHHPVFFFWTQDPLADTKDYINAAHAFFFKWSFAFFMVNGFMVASAVVAFSKIGRY